MINSTIPATANPFDSLHGRTEPTPLTVAFAMTPHNEHHEKHIALFVQSCSTHKITCRPLRISPSSTEDVVAAINQVALTLIVCLDNNYASFVLQAKNKLHISAPVVFIDLEAPKSIQAPLPPKCVAIVPETAHFATHFCSVIPTLPNIRVITILYDQQDPVLSPRVPEIKTWLEQRNYTVNVTTRKPTIISDDLLSIASSELLLFISKSTPEDYAKRLINVCRQHKTLLYTTNATLLAHGAPFAFAVNQECAVAENVAVFNRYLHSNVVSTTANIPYQLLINSYEVASNKALSASLDPFIKLSQIITIVTPTTPEKVSAYLRLEQIPLE